MADENYRETRQQGNPLPDSLIPLIEYPTPHWVVWKWKTSKQGKPTKIPYQAHNPRHKASTIDPSTWASYAEAVAAAKCPSENILNPLNRL
jgi:primase-polymerase (primpol)-like protein